MRRLRFEGLKRLGWKPEVEVEVGDELRHHLDLLIADGIRRGLSPSEAEREALARFGSNETVRRACEELARSRDRAERRLDLLADLRDDFRWTIRSLLRSPAYALGSGLTLALVVLANALVCTLVYAILIRPLPYAEPGRLVALNERTPAGDLWELSQPNLEALRSQSTGFEGLAGWNRNEATLVSEESPRVSVALVTADFFSVLGTPPMLGRVLLPADQNGTEGQALVLSEAAWRTHFGADPAILGRSVTLNTDHFTVVGVMPASFRFPHPAVAAWAPWGPIADWMRNRSVHLMQVVARLAPGTDLPAASAEAATIMSRVQNQHPGEDPEHTLVVRGLQASLTGGVRTTLFLLLGSVGAVLLLASANLAGLAATRTASRQGELALRAALGASRWRVTRQLVVESLVLGLGAGAAGLIAALLLLEPALRLLPAEVPRPAAITLDFTVAAVTLGLAALAGIGIGLVAAWRGGGQDVARQLRSTGAGATQSIERLRLQRLLVATQLALSLILLAGAGLLLRSFQQVLEVDPGYHTERVLTAMVSLPSTRYTGRQVPEWYLGLPARLGQLPGVIQASAVNSLPLSGGDGRGDLTIEDQGFGPGLAPAATYRRVLPNYFSTMGIPLLRGREFTDRDRGAGELVVIVSRSIAERYWPGQDPIGKRIKVGPPEGEPWLTIVGVVGDVRHTDLEAEPLLDTYEPHAQRPRATMGIVVHTASDPAALTTSLRIALRADDQELPVWEIRTLSERLGSSVASRRFTTGVTAGFGAMALLLAAVGVYGVTAYGVGRRQREFAIRLALGAKPDRVRGQVLRESLRVATIGVLAGLPLALVLTRLIASLLYDVSPADPAVFGLTVLLLVLTTIAATWLPAQRTTAVNPVDALRE